MKEKLRRGVAALTALLIVFSVVPNIHIFANSSLSNEVQVYNYLVGKMGLNTAAACGLLANVKAESDFDPMGDGDAGTSFGLFQWHAGRKTSLIDYCNSNGLDYTTIEGQLTYLEYELKKSYSSVYNYIKSVDNTADGAYDAGYYWCYYYEIPANKEVKADRRGETARSVYWKKYQMYNGNTVKEEHQMEPDDYKVSYTRVLKVTDPITIGSDVLYMQLCLYCLGYEIEADGCFGPITASVVKKFQSEHGLDTDGVCGPLTWKAVEAALYSTKLTITRQPKSVTADPGDEVTFSARATGRELQYQWYYKKPSDASWTMWEGMASSSVSATADESWHGMQVKCTVTDGSGNKLDSNSAKVTMNIPFEITQQPQSVTVGVGDTVKFSVKASGIGLRYQWYYRKAGAGQWTLWPGHTTATTSATANEGWHEMQVKCTVTDSSGSALDSSAATVTMNIPLAITQQPQSVTAGVGDTVKFSVKASGIGLRYQWYYRKAGAAEWTLWAGHTTATTSATANEGWHGMQVKCNVTDGDGSALDSSAATVTMNIPLAISQQPQSVTANAGDTVKFSVKASGLGLQYQWYYRKSGAGQWTLWPGHTTATTSATANEGWHGMQVRCTVTDGSGDALDSSAATVTIHIPLAITQQPQSVTAGVGDTVKFIVKARGNNLKYQWYFKKSGAAEWTVWAGHTTATTSAAANEGWHGMQVKCTVTDDSGDTLDSAAATVTMIIPLAITQQPQSVTANPGDTVKFSVKASGIGLQYQWHYKKTGAKVWTVWPGHTTATTSATANESWHGMQVRCRVTDGSGSALDSSAATVTIHIPLTITQQPQSVTANAGDTVKFSVKAGGSNLKYQWYFRKAGAAEWTLWAGHTTATTSATANESWNGMQVRCRVTDGSGSALDSSAAKVTIRIPLAITQQPQPVTANVGDTVKFSVKASGNNLKYQWYFRKAGAAQWTVWPGHTTATTSAAANESWHGMQVRCRVTDGSGSALDSSAAKVTMNIPLAITQQPKSVTASVGDTVKFSVKASGIGLRYQWYYRKAGATEWTVWPGHTTATTSATANGSWHGMQVKCTVTDGSGNKAESKAAAVILDGEEAAVG